MTEQQYKEIISILKLLNENQKKITDYQVLAEKERSENKWNNFFYSLVIIAAIFFVKYNT